MRLVALLLALLLTACGDEAPTPAFYPEENPAVLSAWGALSADGDKLRPGEGVEPYDLNAPLFTDYAGKLRTVWMLSGQASAEQDGSITFPVGTVITKTFYYRSANGGGVLKNAALDPAAGGELTLDEHRLIETRLLVRRKDGWHPVSYVWNEAQTEAHLKRTGAVVPLELAEGSQAGAFAYVVPNENQCAGCHASDATTGLIEPLGPTAGQLNRTDTYARDGRNQLLRLAERGFLRPGEVSARQADWTDSEASLDARARSYLASNCAHCHNPKGPADTSGLDLTLAARGVATGRCKPPIAAGSGTGGRRFGIRPGEPEASILTYRVGSRDPGAMMPELGRSLFHEEGLALLEGWIEQMEGTCAT